MKRVISLFLCAAMVCALLGGCSAQEREAYVPTGDALVMDGQDPDSVNPTEIVEPQHLTLSYYPERSMNPLKSNDYTNRVLFSLIYQGLFAVSSDCKPSPMLCQNYRVSPNNKSWTFYLADATFSDGTPVTVNDVVASYKAAKENKYYSGRFLHIRSVEPSDDGGVVIELDTAYQELPVLLDIPILKATEVDDETPLGSGPYSYEKSLSGAQLRRNLNWWCDATLAATADSITLKAATSTSQIRDDFEFSDINLVCADPYAEDYADFRGDFELWETDNGTFLYLACNVLYSADGIFLEPEQRRVLTYGIDRQSIADMYYNGYAKPATIAASPSSPYYSASLAENYAYDSMKFVEAVPSFGVVKEKVRLLVNKDDTQRLRTARYIAETFTALGLPTETVEVSTSTYIDRVKNGEYDLYLGQTKLSPNMDLSGFFGPWANMSYNGISNNALYELCLAALANSGNYYDLHKALAEDGRIIPILFSGYAIYAERGIVSTLSPSRDNVFYYTRNRTLAEAKLDTIYED